MSQPHELNWVRLPLEGAHNVRELGGYPVAGGIQTQYHRFLRADGLSDLTEKDAKFLYDYGVRTVIDLRDQIEIELSPDISLGEDVTVASIPLLDFDMSSKEELRQRFAAKPPTYEFFYDFMLDKREGIARCMHLIAEAPEGCVLFHCAVGKDRTGILALLLMALAGCDKWDCVANYVQTRANLMRHDWFAAGWGEKGFTALNDSPAHAMEHAWDHLEALGGVAAYLVDCGLTYEEIAAIRARLLN
ncbi:MAG: tyrosine-protein phosphatase [Atopobiaceae bacterium]|nr:tyrosine-protein phosphatase [Atopobiaceae bacterium]